MKIVRLSNLVRFLLAVIIALPIGCTRNDPGKVNSILHRDSSDHVTEPESIGHVPAGLQHSLDHEVHYLDVTGDSSVDTLVLRRKVGKTNISLFEMGLEHDLFCVKPLFSTMPEYLATMPPIERIYLEANGVQSPDKCLRLIIRNTDTDIEYSFFDIRLDGDDVLIGLCGMYDLGESRGEGSLGGDKLCTALYNRRLEPDMNGDKELVPHTILGIFWGNRQACQSQRGNS